MKRNKQKQKQQEMSNILPVYKRRNGGPEIWQQL